MPHFALRNRGVRAHHSASVAQAPSVPQLGQDMHVPRTDTRRCAVCYGGFRVVVPFCYRGLMRLTKVRLCGDLLQLAIPPVLICNAVSQRAIVLSGPDAGHRIMALSSLCTGGSGCSWQWWWWCKEAVDAVLSMCMGLRADSARTVLATVILSVASETYADFGYGCVMRRYRCDRSRMTAHPPSRPIRRTDVR